jgi:hypothetical protein
MAAVGGPGRQGPVDPRQWLGEARPGTMPGARVAGRIQCAQCPLGLSLAPSHLRHSLIKKNKILYSNSSAWESLTIEGLLMLTTVERRG